MRPIILIFGASWLLIGILLGYVGARIVFDEKIYKSQQDVYMAKKDDIGYPLPSEEAAKKFCKDQGPFCVTGVVLCYRPQDKYYKTDTCKKLREMLGVDNAASPHS